MLPPEKRETFIRMWLSGASHEEIASALGIPVNMVSVYVRVLGLPPRKCSPPPNKKIRDEDLELIKKMWLDGARIREIAEYFGVSGFTLYQYLQTMGLRRRSYRRCPDIPQEELEKLCQEGYTDKEIAEMYSTSEYCIAKLRQKYGINKRELVVKRATEKRSKVIETIAEILNEKGHTTSLELRETHGIELNREILRELENSIEGLRWFKLVYTSTSKYSVFPRKFNNLIVVYLQGEERKVLEYLLRNLVDPNVPRESVKWVLKNSGALSELVELL